MQIGVHEINFDNIPDWPKKIRLAAYVIVALAILIFFYVVDIYWKIQALSQVQAQERQLKLDLERNHNTVVNMLVYKKQLQVVQDRYKNIAQQLPLDNQLDTLIDSINAASSAANLELSTLTLQPEEEGSFYAILPIKIIANGTYHQFGNFVAKLTALNHIIIPMDFSINAVENSTINSSQIESLNLSMILNAYYYRGSNLEVKKK